MRWSEILIIICILLFFDSIQNTDASTKALFWPLKMTREFDYERMKRILREVNHIGLKFL